jgi:hypothetical protein
MLYISVKFLIFWRKTSNATVWSEKPYFLHLPCPPLSLLSLLLAHFSLEKCVLFLWICLNICSSWISIRLFSFLPFLNPPNPNYNNFCTRWEHFIFLYIFFLDEIDILSPSNLGNLYLWLVFWKSVLHTK